MEVPTEVLTAPEMAAALVEPREVVMAAVMARAAWKVVGEGVVVLRATVVRMAAGMAMGKQAAETKVAATVVASEVVEEDASEDNQATRTQGLQDDRRQRAPAKIHMHEVQANSP